eukprot:scaffold317096_cov51-Attheya_sp.AAC.2
MRIASAQKIYSTANRLTSRTAVSTRSIRVTPTSVNTGNSYPPVFLTQCRHFSEAPKDILDAKNLLKFETLHELQDHACQAFATNEIFGTYVADDKDGGKFEWMTYEDWGQRVEKCRSVLKDMGVEEYSKIGIISNNRWEWATIAAAAYSLNATLVPMYEAQLPSDWAYILNDSGSTALFCATQDIYDRVLKDVIPSAPLIKSTVCLDAKLGEPHGFATLMKQASAKTSSVLAPTPDDLANLVYTSGTTGKPKGVELTHANTVSNVEGVRTMVDDTHDFIRQTDRSLAFLPWAHSYGQTCELWCGVAHGSGAAICRGVPSLLEDLQLVRPSVLFAVPTLYKRVFDGVNNLIENASPLRKGLMKKALSVGRKRTEAQRGTGPSLGMLDKMQLKVLDGLVLSKIRDRFGGNLRHGFVAGAACPRQVIDFMDDVGIPICEGYGLTETSPIITLNTPYRRQVGSVGQALKDVHVVILSEDGTRNLGPGEEGEICCYGPNVMRGYYGAPDETAKVITLAPDGKSRLFHTGDLGQMNDAGFVSVTGRLKEQYKLENGKYVCPTPIEESIGMSRFIMQVVLCGANRDYNVALLVPDWNALRSELKVGEDFTEDDLANDERVKALIDSEIQSHCQKLKKFETPNAWAFVAPFTAANNMLTPKMSIRRHMVMKTYEDVIAHLYGDEIVVPYSADGVHHEEKKVA